MQLISSVCYGAIALVSLIFGIIYLTRRQFMPYHSLALEKPWSEVEPNTQTLILALMRVTGGGFMTTAIAISVLLYFPFAEGEQWAAYSLFLICFCTSAGSGYATYLVRRHTPGNPPFKLSIMTIALSIIGFGCSLY